MTTKTNTREFICNTAMLAELFGCTLRNIGHYIDRGMPVRDLGKAGREHVFNAPDAMQWFLGMRTCERLGRSLPGQLETALIGLFGIGRELSGQTFNERLQHGRSMAREMGYTPQDYDRAVDYLLANKLIRW